MSKDRQRILRHRSHEVFWNDDHDIFSISSVDFVQIFLDKNASSLKCFAPVAYPVHSIFMNVTHGYKRWLVKSSTAWSLFFMLSVLQKSQVLKIDFLQQKSLCMRTVLLL